MNVLQEILVSQETVNDEFVTVAKIYHKTGDKVKPGDMLIDIETSKSVVVIEAEQEGFVEYLCKEEDDVAVGSIIIKIYDQVPEPSEDKDEAGSAKSLEQAAKTVETLFSKDALALMKEKGIEKSRFAGRDFVAIQDVQKLLDPAPDAIGSAAADDKRETDKPVRVDSDKVDLEKISAHKRTEINYLSQVQSSDLISTIYMYINVEGIFPFINKSMEIFKNSLLPLLTYESARLLKKYREFNAFFAGGNIAYYKDVHIGIAVDIDDGLKVLKIPDTETKSLQAIEKEIFDLSNKYLDRHLSLDDITGSTFTITDLSSEKVSFFSPLINKEQSSILAVSGIDEKLDRCTLSLAFDHRVTDGKQASIFMNDLRDRIESYKSADEGGEKRKEMQCDVCLKTLEEDKELRGIGLIKIVNHDGAEKTICHVCLGRF